MAKFIIKKSEPLRGEVEVSGAKNAVLPILAATILAPDTFEIFDAPNLRDVEIMCDILRALGAEVNVFPEEHRITVDARSVCVSEVPAPLVRLMRASFFVMGPLLGRMGKAAVSVPGGCAIGERPVDLHIKGFKSLGARVVSEDNMVIGSVDRLRGDLIYLDFPSVGATENIMMAACLAEGVTTIENAAEEPEIVDLANFLNKMGAKIRGAGTDTIKIEGVAELHGARHTVIPDRIETGSFMLAAAITRGNVLIKNCVPGHVKPVMAKLMECGVSVEDGPDGLRVNAEGGSLISTDVKTLPYPGFPTDMQAPFMAFLATVEGESTINETVFENRFMHVGELNRMGANIRTDERTAYIPGNVRPLSGARVVSTDLRGGMALVLAGLAAVGRTEISDIYHIERGYEELEKKLSTLGARIERIEDDED